MRMKCRDPNVMSGLTALKLGLASIGLSLILFFAFPDQASPQSRRSRSSRSEGDDRLWCMARGKGQIPPPPSRNHATR
jgi:hypothetical protein